MGPKERRERERESVRTLIIEAAREMFAEEGYEAVTMRRIADRIEYSPTAIYFHFKDKEAVIRAICDSDFYTLAQQFGDIAGIDDPFERMRRTGLAYAKFGLENRNHYRLMFMTPHPPLDPQDSEVEHGNPEEDAYAFLVTITTDAVSRGLIREDVSDPHLIAQIVWSAVHGVVALEIAKCNDGWIEFRSMEERLRLAIDLLLDGLSRRER